MATFFYKMRVDEGSKKTFIDLCEHMSEVRMISFILGHLVNRTSMDFYMNREIRTRIAAYCRISELTVNRNLTTLTKREILIRKSRGVYGFNSDMIDFGHYEAPKGRLAQLLNPRL